jgi:hypothetical protein
LPETVASGGEASFCREATVFPGTYYGRQAKVMVDKTKRAYRDLSSPGEAPSYISQKDLPFPFNGSDSENSLLSLKPKANNGRFLKYGTRFHP